MAKKPYRRVVIKIGSSLLTRDDGSLNRARLGTLVSQVATVRSHGVSPIVVTSGAIACGVEALGLKARPRAIELLQAAASVGQSRLVEEYAREFQGFSVVVGQVLLTQADFIHRESYVNAQRAVEKLLALGVVPIVNENDVTAVEEIRFGDNDTLAALLACMVSADLLIILSDVDGVYRDRNDPSTLIAEVDEITDDIERIALGAGTPFGSGGMITKIRAARIVTCAGVEMVIASGRQDGIIESVLGHDEAGTRFLARRRVRGRKHWIAWVLPTKGRLVVDDGAHHALVTRGKSLLPAGVKAVEGGFNIGDAVEIVDERGEVFAKGIAEYGTEELRAIIGKGRDEVAEARPGAYVDEVVHRDKLVILRDENGKELIEIDRC